MNMLFSTLGTIGFGTLDLIGNTDAFIIVACVTRGFSGFMSGGAATVIFGFLPTLYPDRLP